jgi:hypothetical protein
MDQWNSSLPYLRLLNNIGILRDDFQKEIITNFCDQ